MRLHASGGRPTACAAVAAALVLGLVGCAPAASCTPAASCLPTRGTSDRAPLLPSIGLATLGSGPLTSRLARAPSGSIVALPPGTTEFSDFAPAPDATFIGLDLPTNLGGLTGTGRGSTVAMTPHSSTRSSDIPSRFPESNRLSLLRITSTTPRLHHLVLLGTDQGHPYNGLLVEKVRDAAITDVRVIGIPGSDHQPPGETFGINDYRTVGSTYAQVVVDGAQVGAAGFGANASKDLTIDGAVFTRNRFSAGATFWEVDDITLRDVRAISNGLLGFNFERVGGVVHIVRPVLHANGGGDVRIASDFGSARYVFEDPVLDGGRLRVVLPATYNGRPNLQRVEDISVRVHGVDRTSRILELVSP